MEVFLKGLVCWVPIPTSWLPIVSVVVVSISSPPYIIYIYIAFSEPICLIPTDEVNYTSSYRLLPRTG